MQVQGQMLGCSGGTLGAKLPLPHIPRWQEKGWKGGGAGHVVGAGAHSHSA